MYGVKGKEVVFDICLIKRLRRKKRSYEQIFGVAFYQFFDTAPPKKMPKIHPKIHTFFILLYSFCRIFRFHSDIS